MSLIFFAVLFVIVNIVLWKWAESMLVNGSNNIIANESCYITSYVKGTVRGIIGKIESNASLEEKRLFLKKKNIKF